MIRRQKRILHIKFMNFEIFSFKICVQFRVPVKFCVGTAKKHLNLTEMESPPLIATLKFLKTNFETDSS